MNEIVKINYSDYDHPTVSGRELHQALQVKTAYKDWFPRMCEYGFDDGVDFSSILSKSTGGRPSIDHRLTINMAKELCMIQRSEIGKTVRQYFLKVEEAWNSPDAIMARALQFANQRLLSLEQRNEKLTQTVAVQEEKILELEPKARYCDIVLACKDVVPITVIAKDYGWSAVTMNRYLHSKGVQYCRNGTWVLYQKHANRGYTGTKTYTYEDEQGQSHSKIQTFWTQTGRLFLYELLKQDGILPVMERAAG